MLRTRTFQLEGEPEQQQQPAPDLAGYPDVNALVQGYRASGQEAQRLKAENEALKQYASVAANQRPDIPQRPVDPFQVLTNDYAMPGDIIRTAIDARVSEAVDQRLKPMTEGWQARNQMLATYGPDYTKFESDVYQYVASDPTVSQAVASIGQTNPAAALDYAFLKFGESRRRASGGRPAEVSREAQSEAQIPNTRSGDARNPERQQANGKAQAWEHYNKTGNAIPYAKAILGNVITDEFLGK